VNKTTIAVNIFNKFANEYQAKFMEFSLYNDSYDLFCDSIQTSNASILDVACGPGNITRYLLQKRSDFNIIGIDLAPKMLELAKLNNPAAQFRLSDGRDLLKLKRKFDGIMCGFLFPYLSEDECVQFISNAAKTLNTNGVLYISTMEEDEKHRSGLKKTANGNELYMYYHKYENLVDAIKKNNLTVVSVLRKEFHEENGMVTDLIILAKKEEKQ
jgi:2-polyprenyl-3-methyl-5-hydroxy-6-metoxy-1,4-benzoquinol methylase